MFRPSFISALNLPWAISPEHIEQWLPVIDGVFNSSIEFEKGEPIQPKVISIEASSSLGKSGAKQSGVKNIQVITISGPVMKDDQYCGPAGMKSMGTWIQNADRNPDIDGILLVIDSPGGTVAGTEELSNIIKGTKKPIVAFVEDLAASAGYWIGSSANEIIANNTTAQVGSIGVLMSFDDIIPALEQMGIKRHTVVAPQSKDKVAMWEKLRKGDYEEYKNTVLAPLAEKFINTVKANRPDVKDDQLTGKVFFAKDVLGSMVDSIGSIDFALQRVADLAAAVPSATLNSQNNNMSKTEYKRLAKASGVEALESADGTVTLTGEMADAVETALEAAETEQARLQGLIDASNDQSARVTELEGQLSEANTRISELSGKPAAEPAKVIKENDGNSASDQEESFFGRYNRLRKS